MILESNPNDKKCNVYLLLRYSQNKNSRLGHFKENTLLIRIFKTCQLNIHAWLIQKINKKRSW